MAQTNDIAAKDTPRRRARALNRLVSRPILQSPFLTQSPCIAQYIGRMPPGGHSLIGYQNLAPAANQYCVTFVRSGRISFKCAVSGSDSPISVTRESERKVVLLAELLEPQSGIHRDTHYGRAQGLELRKQLVELNRFRCSARRHCPWEEVQHHGAFLQESGQIDVSRRTRRHEQWSPVSRDQHSRASPTAPPPPAG